RTSALRCSLSAARTICSAVSNDSGPCSMSTMTKSKPAAVMTLTTPAEGRTHHVPRAGRPSRSNRFRRLACRIGSLAVVSVGSRRLREAVRAQPVLDDRNLPLEVDVEAEVGLERVDARAHPLERQLPGLHVRE